MLRSHQKLELENKCLIEKVVLEAPFRFSVHFHDEACFIYFLKGAAKINSPVGQIDIGPKEAVLLQCGSYFADLLKYGTSGEYEILVPVFKYQQPIVLRGHKYTVRTRCPHDMDIILYVLQPAGQGGVSNLQEFRREHIVHA